MPFPMAVGALGSLGGSLLGAAGSWFSGKQAADTAERAYKHRYQWQVKDMIKAGLNPMLSFSQGAPNVPATERPNIGEGAIKGFSAVQGARLTNAQINLTEAQAQKAYNEAKISELQVDINQWLRNPENLAIMREIALESPQVSLSNMKLQGKEVAQNIENKVQELKNLSVDEALKKFDLKQRQELMEFTIRLAKAQAELTEAGLPEAKAWAEVWDKYGKQLIYSREAKGWIEMLINRFNFFGFKGGSGMQMPSSVGQPSGMGGYPYVKP